MISSTIPLACSNYSSCLQNSYIGPCGAGGWSGCGRLEGLLFVGSFPASQNVFNERHLKWEKKTWYRRPNSTWGVGSVLTNFQVASENL
jgi:hypothetical protein